jgi:hypothetical protein
MKSTTEGARVQDSPGTNQKEMIQFFVEVIKKSVWNLRERYVFLQVVNR